MTEAVPPGEIYLASQAEPLPSLRPVAANKIPGGSPPLAFHLQFVQFNRRAFAASDKKMIAGHFEFRRSQFQFDLSRPPYL
jgi:hypothetical protein